MTASDPNSLKSIGFLTVLQHQEKGMFGGYLVITTTGRPLEFHCTTPIKANRAQQILYGPTLAPFLYGEQIGKTLLSQATAKPLFVCTDVEPALAVRPFVSFPVALIEPTQSDAPSDATILRHDERHDRVKPPTASTLVRFTLGEHRVAVSSTHDGDRQAVVDRWREHFEGFDLPEPFERIREAVKEAQRNVG